MGLNCKEYTHPRLSISGHFRSVRVVSGQFVNSLNQVARTETRAYSWYTLLGIRPALCNPYLEFSEFLVVIAVAEIEVGELGGNSIENIWLENSLEFWLEIPYTNTVAPACMVSVFSIENWPYKRADLTSIHPFYSDQGMPTINITREDRGRFNSHQKELSALFCDVNFVLTIFKFESECKKSSNLLLFLLSFF